MTQIANQVAVITGAASGIGRALAVALSSRDCALALADRNLEGLEHTQGLCSSGSPVTLHQVDVSDREAMERFVEEVIAAHGRVNLLFNNAGVTVMGYFDETSLEDFEWVLDVNVKGVLYGCKLFLPHLMQARPAHIVNVSSIFGVIGVPMQSAYCTSKYAVRGLSEVLWEELAETHVKVTVVHPGGVATNIVKDGRSYDNALTARLTKSFERLLSPEKAAARILRGVERDQRRVIVGADARFADWVRRMVPVWGNRLMAVLLGSSEAKDSHRARIAERASGRNPEGS